MRFFVVCDRKDIWFTGIFEKLVNYQFKEDMADDEVVGRLVLKGDEQGRSTLKYSFPRSVVRFALTYDEACKIRERFKMFM